MTAPLDPVTRAKLTTAIGPVERIKWLEQVAGDARLGDAAKSFAISVQHFVNRGAGFAYCGSRALAERAGVAERTAKLRLASLGEAGHIVIQRRGPYPAALFLVLKDVQESCTSLEAKDVQESCTSDSKRGARIRYDDVQDPGKKKCKPNFFHAEKSDRYPPNNLGSNLGNNLGSAAASEARHSAPSSASSQAPQRTDSEYASSDGSSLSRLPARSLPSEDRNRSAAEHPCIAVTKTEAPKRKRCTIDYRKVLSRLDER